MNQIEAAKLIISQGGSCAGVPCNVCPACPEVFGLHNKLQKFFWFKNWLKENDKENKMSDKIQMTEQQAREITRVIHNNCSQFGHDEDYYINNLKKAGYIIKSGLQHKIEEVESEFKKYEYEDALDSLHKIQHDVIQLLKQSHPEFKK